MEQVQIFTSSDGKARLEVALEKETVWLSQAQMVELFGRDQSVISRHINNALKEGEVLEESNMQKMHIANSDRPVAFYDLDVVISVGYRIKSERGVQFRRWATSILKAHLVQGYTLNQKRLIERGVEFEQAINLLSRTLSNQGLVTDEGVIVASVISDYARSWSLLQGYDEQKLSELNIKQSEMLPLSFSDSVNAIADLKKTLIAKGEATELFGQIRGDGLESVMFKILCHL